MKKDLKIGYYRVAENSVKFYDPSQPKDLAPRGLVFNNQGVVKLAETEAVISARAGGRLVACQERDFLEQEKAKEEKPTDEKPKTGKDKDKATATE